jgi:hypothetical protein
MALVSDAKIARLRAKLDRKVLVHTYTRAPQTTPTDDDAWGEKDAGSGTTTTAVACVYGNVQRVVRDAGGVTVVTVPALTVSASDPLAIGDRVSNVTDQLGGVLLVGPARVESLLEARGAELGASLQYVYELRVGTVSG